MGAEGGSGRGRETVGGGREQREGERDRGSEHLSTVWKENIHLRVPFLDGDVEEVDKPGERVLVHGVNVGQVRDGEEEDRAVGSHWLIPCTRLLYLALCLLSNLRGGRRQSHVLSVSERSHFSPPPPPSSLTSPSSFSSSPFILHLFTPHIPSASWRSHWRELLKSLGSVWRSRPPGCSPPRTRGSPESCLQSPSAVSCSLRSALSEHYAPPPTQACVCEGMRGEGVKGEGVNGEGVQVRV